MARFKKGNPGGPGRPRKDAQLKTVLAWTIDEAKFKDDKTGVSYTGREAVARKLLSLALGGDIQAIRIVLDRIDGPVKQELIHSGALSLGDLIKKVDSSDASKE